LKPAAVPLDPIHVVVGLIRDTTGRLLLNQRPPGAPMAGWWEFPGGKRRDDEAPWEALTRELDEELGIGVRAGERLLEFCHAYADKRVHLDVWRIEKYEGEPWARERQQLAWLAPEEIAGLKLLEADWPIVDLLLGRDLADQQSANQNRTS
jgi:8-oxo-dGTP diphosphatase